VVIGTVASNAANRPAASNAAVPTGATNRASRDGSTIAIDNRHIDVVADSSLA
jgi:hypothetical protein